MKIIYEPGGINRIAYPGVRQILSQRVSELKLLEKESLAEIGCFVVAEPNDSVTDLERSSGCAITTDLFGDSHYGSPDFVPCHEWLEYHTEQHCFEMVFVMTDDGYFTAVFVPDDPGIDPMLLAFCREYS